jgi:hypothetical protein
MSASGTRRVNGVGLMVMMLLGRLDRPLSF